MPGELAALIGVENLRPAVTGQSFLQRLDAELGFHRDRHPPGQNPAAEPVDHGRQIDEAARHRDVGDVHRPDLVGPHDRQLAQQIRDRSCAPAPASRCSADDRSPRSPSASSAWPHAGGRSRRPRPQQIAQHPAAGKRVVQMQFVDPPHDRQIGRRHRPGQVIYAAAADRPAPGLPRQRQDCSRSIIALRSARVRLCRAHRPKNRSPASTRRSWRAVPSGPPPAGASIPEAPEPKTPAAPSSSCAFQVVIWFG